MRRLKTPYMQLWIEHSRLMATHEVLRMEWVALVKRCGEYVRTIQELKDRIAELEQDR